MSYSTQRPVTLDGNEAAVHVAYRVNEVCAIYPITPSSAMADFADEWSAKDIKNIWGKIPEVNEQFAVLGMVPDWRSPADTNQFLKTEVARWARIARESGAKGE